MFRFSISRRFTIENSEQLDKDVCCHEPLHDRPRRGSQLNALTDLASFISPRLSYLKRMCVVVALFCFVGAGASSHAQTSLSRPSELTPEIRQGLSRRIDLEVRDATLLEALFSVRDSSGLNIVVGNEVTGTVNASFKNTAVYDILDSLLITRGYGYRVVGGSLAIVPLASLGDQLPLFDTQVIGLQYCTPGDLLQSIESMISPEGRAHAVESSRSIVIVDYPQRIEAIRKHVDSLERAAESYQQQRRSTVTTPDASIPTGTVQREEPIVRVFTPQYVSSVVLAEAILPLLSADGRAAAMELEDKLVVSDSPSAVRRVAAALQELDRPRPQVRIWAMIYDCGLEDLDRLGINWRAGANGSSIDTATGNAAQSILVDSVTAAVGSGANGTLTISSLNRNFNLQSVVQALNTADDSRLLADPNVVVMNHESAEIAIVTEVPYQQLTQGLEGGTIGTTEFREAGVTLNVTPHIARDETISLLVNPQFSLLAGFSDPDNAPIIDRRETKTTVRVANNQTIVLGGLRQRTRIANRSKIPIIGDVPYFGHLFRHRSSSARESELIVFITPQIVIPGYCGVQREHCMARQLQVEIDETPTDPVPFGIDSLLAEERARSQCLNENCHLQQNQCNCPSCARSQDALMIDGMIQTDQLEAVSERPTAETRMLEPVVIELFE